MTEDGVEEEEEEEEEVLKKQIKRAIIGVHFAHEHMKAVLKLMIAVFLPSSQF